MMTEQQAIDFAKSSAIAVFSEDGTEADHRENIRDTLNDERSSEHEETAFAAFDAKLAALRGAAPVAVEAAAQIVTVKTGERKPFDSRALAEILRKPAISREALQAMEREWAKRGSAWFDRSEA